MLVEHQQQDVRPLGRGVHSLQLRASGASASSRAQQGFEPATYGSGVTREETIAIPRMQPAARERLYGARPVEIPPTRRWLEGVTAR
jgi:hypothetical protein